MSKHLSVLSDKKMGSYTVATEQKYFFKNYLLYYKMKLKKIAYPGFLISNVEKSYNSLLEKVLQFENSKLVVLDVCTLFKE